MIPGCVRSSVAGRLGCRPFGSSAPGRPRTGESRRTRPARYFGTHDQRFFCQLLSRAIFGRGSRRPEAFVQDRVVPVYSFRVFLRLRRSCIGRSALFPLVHWRARWTWVDCVGVSTGDFTGVVCVPPDLSRCHAQSPQVGTGQEQRTCLHRVRLQQDRYGVGLVPGMWRSHLAVSRVQKADHWKSERTMYKVRRAPCFPRRTHAPRTACSGKPFVRAARGMAGLAGRAERF